MEEAIVYGQVLSIQSHVVHGYVGNRAAVFPLQLLGFDVDCLNSVQFSNHTGYKSFKGQRLSGQDVEDLYQGLEENNLCNYTHVLTGYMGTKTFLSSVMKVIDKLKQKNQDLLYVCDPVLGDEGKLYVPPELIDIYRQDILPRANMVTPNQFEAEKLSEIKIKTLDDALNVVDWFHTKGIPTVIITSIVLEQRDGHLTLVASNKKQNGEKEQYEIVFPSLRGYFTGTGDFVAALLLAWTTILKNDFKGAIEHALAGIQAVLQRTPTGNELRLIQCRNFIPNPIIQYHAKQIQK
jgi:pyridoxine kinase